MELSWNRSNYISSDLMTKCIWAVWSACGPSLKLLHRKHFKQTSAEADLKFWAEIWSICGPWGGSKLLEQARKARKTRTSPGTLGLKKFGLGKLWVKNVFGKYTFEKYTFKKYTFNQYTFKKYTFKKYTFRKYTFGKYTFWKYIFGKYTKIIGVLSLQLFT